MAKKSKEIKFTLVDINTEQFASFQDKFDSQNSEIEISFGVDFKLDSQDHLIGVFTRYEFLQKNQVVLMLECSCGFEIESNYWKSCIKGEKIIFPPFLLTHLLVLCVGTARGIIHAKKPVQLQQLMLPTLNVSQIITEDMAFSLN